MVVLAKTIRIKAMDLLARREHSVKELVRKLSERFEDDELIDKVVQQLTEDNLVSNSRFAEMYVRSRIGRHCGQVRIENDLRERGVSDQLIAAALEEAGQDWFQLIRELSLKKYANTPPFDAKETAKRIRFFQYRGFDFNQIKHALEQCRE